MNTYYTIYKTTNKINGKIYIGCHKTNDLEDGYMGSGKILLYAIDKYGVENFIKEIIEVFDNPKAMFEMEATLVNEEFVNSTETYNICEGGKGGFGYINANGLGFHNYNIPHADGLARHQWLYANDESYRLNYSIKRRAIALRDNFGQAFAGKRHTSDSKIKIGIASSIHQMGNGNSQYGTMWIYSNELRQCKRINKTHPIPPGWVRGRKMKFK